MIKRNNTNKGITLIALVITIIVMLILVAVTISMAVNGGLFNYAEKAVSETQNARDEEQKLANGGVKIDGEWYNSIDEYLNGGSLTLGAVYTDDMIGQPITYSANGQTSWIVFGKDTNGNILITTELPIDEAFELYGSAEKWLTYENDLHTACNSYGGTVQGVAVTSRSITMEDINYVAGFTKPTFETFTFGSTHGWNSETDEWDSNNVNYYYPSTSASANSYWQDPTSVSGTFANDWYCYYCDWDTGEYFYWGADTDGNDVSASERNIKTDNCKYIWGGNTEETCYNEYLVASRSVDVYSGDARFFVARVGYSGVYAYYYGLCDSGAGGGSDRGEIGSFGVRPIVVLPSKLLVEEQSDGTYDLAK